MQKVLGQEKPALMLLCHGGNDLLRRLDRQKAAENIRAMIRMAREKGTAVVLIAIPSAGLSLSPPSMYAEIAEEMSIPIKEDPLIYCPRAVLNRTITSQFRGIPPNGRVHCRLTQKERRHVLIWHLCWPLPEKACLP